MSTVAIAQASASRPVNNAWFVPAAVIIPTFMEVLDTTVAIVSLRYIAGELSAAVVDAEWILTSHLAANATILPISGWLLSRLGRRNYFLWSIAVFTIASALCGMATSLWQIILFRVLPGRGGCPHRGRINWFAAPIPKSNSQLSLQFLTFKNSR